MHCSNCGTKIEEGAAFCQSCGKATNKEKSVLSENISSGSKFSNLFKGRIQRKHWLFGVILLIGIFFVAASLIEMVTVNISEDLVFILLMPLYIVYAVFLFSLHIRRLHDLNHSGWAVLVFIIPIANLALLLTLALSAGKDEANKYGKKPAPNTKLFDVLLGKVS